MKKKSGGVYAIICTTSNKWYVGSTKNFATRKKAHFTELRHNQHDNDHLQNAFNKHGEATFVFLVVEEVEEEHLVQREQVWIDTMQAANPAKGYNLSPTAGRTTHTEETRRKISEFLRTRPCTDETRRKFSKITAERNKTRTGSGRMKPNAKSANPTRPEYALPKLDASYQKHSRVAKTTTLASKYLKKLKRK